MLLIGYRILEDFMDVAQIPQLAQGVLTLLAPCLPFLTGLGETAAEEGAKKVGEDTWALAKKIWGKMSPRIHRIPAAADALADVVTMPDDTDAGSALRLQIRKLLASDPVLAKEVAEMLQAIPASNSTANAIGNQSVAVGRDATGHIITGNTTTGRG
jgi:hypothetical protein